MTTNTVAPVALEKLGLTALKGHAAALSPKKLLSLSTYLINLLATQTAAPAIEAAADAASAGAADYESLLNQPVLAPWNDGVWYPATLLKIKGGSKNKFKVRWADGTPDQYVAEVKSPKTAKPHKASAAAPSASKPEGKGRGKVKAEKSVKPAVEAKPASDAKPAKAAAKAKTETKAKPPKLSPEAQKVAQKEMVALAAEAVAKRTADLVKTAPAPAPVAATAAKGKDRAEKAA